MLRVFPQLADVPIDYGWGGTLAITRTRLPHFARLAPEVFVAHGYSGQGIALATLAGKLIAEAIAGTAERFDVMAGLPLRPFPGARCCAARRCSPACSTTACATGCRRRPNRRVPTAAPDARAPAFQGHGPGTGCVAQPLAPRRRLAQPAGAGVGGQRRAAHEGLHRIAAAAPQERQLLVAVDPFGDHPQAEVLRRARSAPGPQRRAGGRRARPDGSRAPA